MLSRFAKHSDAKQCGRLRGLNPGNNPRNPYGIQVKGCEYPPQPLWNSVEGEAGRCPLLVLHVNRDLLIVRDLAREDEARERIADLLLH